MQTPVMTGNKTGACQRRGNRRLAAVLMPSLLVVLTACMSSDPMLWPPTRPDPARLIYVSLDTWHGMIAFPHRGDGKEGGSLPDRGRPGSVIYEEWGFAERGWYLEGRQGTGGALRALLWPSAGVVEVGWHERIWAERTPDPPADVFVFRLSEEGHRRLRRYLAATRASPEPIRVRGASEFYPSVRSYGVLWTCHHYVAAALEQAGVPVSKWWAFSRSSLAWQLSRARARDS